MYLPHGLSTLSTALSRSISPENFTGEKARWDGHHRHRGKCGCDLGQGWKVSPSVVIKPGETFTMGEIRESGIIQHIWLTCFPAHWRSLIFRIYWDDEEYPSVETPVGDFFCNGWCERSNVNSLPICVNPAGGMNSYWEMPFRKSACLTMENIGQKEAVLYYQIDYSLTPVPDSVGYLHAQFRRSNPLPYKEVHTILDGAKGQGHYVGTYIAWGVNNNGWWGEGEVKFYIDGDRDFPTICGTGTEDYFGGAWNFEHPPGQYGIYSTPFLGLSQVIKGDGLYRTQQRFGMYRWHIPDPIRFQQDLRVTIQALGWRSEADTFLQDDISSLAVWYQSEPMRLFPSWAG